MVCIMVNPMDEDEVLCEPSEVPAPPSTELTVRVQGHRTWKNGDLVQNVMRIDNVGGAMGQYCEPIAGWSEGQELRAMASPDSPLSRAQRKDIIQSVNTMDLMKEFYETHDIARQKTREAADLRKTVTTLEPKLSRLEKKVINLEPLAKAHRALKKDQSDGGLEGAKITNAAKAKRGARWETAVADLMEPTTLTGEMKTVRQMAKDCWNKPESEWIRAGILKEDGIPSEETIRKIIAKLPE